MENKLFETISAFFTAFGAGMLMSAAIFEMIIEANRVLGIIITFITFIAGAVIFTIADIIAERKGGGAGILLGIGLDAIPESITFGVLIGSGSAYALAILIGIQNIPEGIASFKEMTTGRTPYTQKSIGSDRNSFGNTSLHGFIRIFLSSRNDKYNFNHSCYICWRNILYVVL